MKLNLRGGTSHVSYGIASTRVPLANSAEDAFINKSIARAYNRVVQLDTSNLGMITIVNTRDITFHLRGYLVQSDRSRVRFDEATRQRTAFEFSDRITTGPLTWDRYLFLESLLNRLGIHCAALSQHRRVLEVRDQLQQQCVERLVAEASEGMLWLATDDEGKRAATVLEVHLQQLGFSRRERGDGRALWPPT